MKRAGLFGVQRGRPWSCQAFLLGLAVVAMSVLLQGICVALGVRSGGLKPSAESAVTNPQ